MKNLFKSSSKKIIVPLRFSKSQHLIGAFLLNKKPATFLIDTGASNSCVDRRRADHFNLEAEGDDLPLQGAGQEKLYAQSSGKKSLYYSDQEICHLCFILIDMDSINIALAEQEEGDIDGIIGADILHKKKAVIDYDQCCLYLNESSWF
jgi:predicted aspartyl protease